MIKDFAEANKVLSGYVPPSREFRGKYNLDNMRALMAELGNPQDKFKVVHVAGTSGKTSTCYYIASMLQAGGAKVGLTVSPYVDEVNERVQINLQPLPEKHFCRALTEFLNIVNKLTIKPTYFELLVAFAYWEFARQQVDYAVVEVGLGGLLDGTNVISRNDKVCVITDIGLDHTNILGKTIPEIAFQKAGIIHTGNIVIMHQQSGEVMKVVEQKTKEEKAQLKLIGQNKHIAHNDLPWFQRRNWQLANEVYSFLQQRDNLKKLGEKELHQSMRTHIPARMEVVKKGDKTIIMDGAHNPQKLHALVRSLQLKFPTQKMTIVFGVLDEKELKDSLNELKLVAGTLIATSFPAEQDMPRASANPNKVAKVAEELGIKAQVEAEPERALRQALSQSDFVLIAGSFFLLNHIRPLILNSDDTGNSSY